MVWSGLSTSNSLFPYSLDHPWLLVTCYRLCEDLEIIKKHLLSSWSIHFSMSNENVNNSYNDNSSYLSEAYWVATCMCHFINNHVRDRLLLNSFSRQESWDSKSLSPNVTNPGAPHLCIILLPFLKNGRCPWPTGTLGVKAEEPIRTAESIKWVGTIHTRKQFLNNLEIGSILFHCSGYGH